MRILVATVPADGHFNPLTGIAVHLKERGHDVRWYTGRRFAATLERLGIPHISFKRARELDDEAPDVVSERARLRGLALMRYDLDRFFVSNVEGYFLDIQELEASFPFDVLFCDGAFMATALVKAKLGTHVCVIGLGAAPDAGDSPPPMTGFKPARTPIGRLAYRGMRAGMEWLASGRAKAAYNRTLAAHGLAPITTPMFGEASRLADVIFAQGVPGFAYSTRNPNPKVKFVGVLRPPRHATDRPFLHAEKLAASERVILISQGTVDNKDLGKLIVPALDALKDTGALLLVTTGGSSAAGLRRSHPQDNVVIEEFIDYDFALEHADLFVTNGGAGGVLLSLSKGVPVLGAGVREGKNQINARVDYFRVGIDLRTERPRPAAIRRAADRLLSEPQWKQRAERLGKEFGRYQPEQLIDEYLATLPSSEPLHAAGTA